MKKSDLSTRRFPPCQPPAADPAIAAALVPQRRVSLLRLLLLAWIAGLALLATPLFAVSPQGLDIVLKGIGAPAAPHMLPGSDVLIFSYRQDRSARSVAARFDHEGYRILHQFSRNELGVFVLDYPVPEGVREIRYRIVVDGLWMSDPSNPRVQTDELGMEFSLFTLDREPPRAVANPRFEKDGTITFMFRGPPSRRVSIVGDWNGWDPFLDYMTETDRGVYRISLRMRPGRHWYYFVTEGRRVLDVSNPATGTDPEGAAVSYFSFPPG